MPHLVHSESLRKVVGDWVSQRIDNMGEVGFDGQYNAIAVVHDDALVAGVVYHDWCPKYKTIQMSIAAHSPHWATRKTISGLLHYPFIELGIQRITIVVKATNDRSLRLTEGIGFKREAILERGAGEHGDLIVLRLFIEDWLNSKFNCENTHGQTIRTKAA